MTIETPDTADTEPQLVDDRPSRDRFLSDVLDGLTRSPKRLWPKYFYDARGSELFDEITTVAEYYIPRAEHAVYTSRGDAIAEAIGANAVLIEPGSGSSEKSEWVLDLLETPAAYVPVEISRSAVESATERLRDRYPDLPIHPFAGDFTQPINLPQLTEDDDERTRHVVFFPGSTLGNFEADARHQLLTNFRELAGPDGMLLIGLDLAKPAEQVEPAYNDAAGVTARFNLNLLERINRELDADFDLERFEHRAVYDPSERRIEMRLIAREAQTVTIDGETFAFEPGEHILTEYSHKFTDVSIRDELQEAGFTLVHLWTDPEGKFAVALAES